MLNEYDIVIIVFYLNVLLQFIFTSNYVNLSYINLKYIAVHLNITKKCLNLLITNDTPP